MPGTVSSLKTLVEVGPDDWTVFAGQPAASTRIIDADIATVSGAADKVLRVEGKPPYLLHLEFVAGHDAADLPSALNKRNVLLGGSGQGNNYGKCKGENAKGPA